MSSTFNHAVKQNQQLKRDLEKLAEAPEDAPVSLQGQISATMTSFQRTIDSYAQAVSNELVAEKKKQGEERLAKFRSDLAEARDQFHELKRRREETITSANRQELFSRRTATTEAADNPYEWKQSDYTREQGLARESDVLGSTSQKLDEFIEMGRSVLGDLGDQNQLLRNTQRTFTKAATTLGISGETISKVQHHLAQDKRFFYGGIVVLVICFILIVRWLK